jgi:predicted dehydrogenase
MPSPVRFAILGFGHFASRRLVPAFQRSEQAVLTGIWRRNQEAAASACAEHQLPHCFASPEVLCASPDVDVVYITSPDAMHRDDSLLAFRHGKAVLCEKPLAMNAAEAQEIQSAAEAAGTLFGVGQNFRYNRSVELLRELIHGGKIGQPQLAHAQYAYPAQAAPRKWIADPSLACGGPIADVGVHCIDTLRYVLGANVETVSVLARKTEESAAVEAIASMQLELSGGVFANVTASSRAPYRTLLEVTGSEGVLIAENGLTVDRPVDVVLRKAGAVCETFTVDNGDGYLRMIDAFAHAFRSRGTFAANGPDAVLNQRALDAAYRSWRSGQRETV